MLPGPMSFLVLLFLLASMVLFYLLLLVGGICIFLIACEQGLDSYYFCNLVVFILDIYETPFSCIGSGEGHDL